MSVMQTKTKEGAMRVEDIQKKVRGSWWADGIPDIVSGIGLLIIGILTMFRDAMESAYGAIGGVAYIVSFALIVLAVQYMVKWAKGRWSWPYSGYSIPRRNITLRDVIIFLIAMGMVGIAFFLQNTLLKSIALGLFSAVILVGISLYSGFKRFYWYALVALATSIVSGLLSYSTDVIVGAMLGATGLVMFLTGIVVFSNFRRSIHEGNIQEDN